MSPCLLLKNGVCHTQDVSCILQLYNHNLLKCSLLSLSKEIFRICLPARCCWLVAVERCVRMHFQHCEVSLTAFCISLLATFAIFAAEVKIFIHFFHHTLAGRCTSAKPGNFRITFATKLSIAFYVSVSIIRPIERFSAEGKICCYQHVQGAVTVLLCTLTNILKLFQRVA